MDYDIFISYRHADSQQQAQTLFAQLEIEFGYNKVFLDKCSIPIGASWTDALHAAIKSARIVLAIIGPEWEKTTSQQPDKLHTSDEDDWVRLEILSSLLNEQPVVPVLIKGAKPPAHVAGLFKRQGVELREAHMEEDTEQFIRRLHEALRGAGSQASIKSVKERLQDMVKPRYTIGKFLSWRNSAVVYKAYDTVLRRDVAIKMFDDIWNVGDFDERVRKAVEISDEAHFITIYEASLEQQHYYVMQFIDGTPNRETLRKQIDYGYQELSYAEIRNIILSIGDALVRAYSNGKQITNIDIKPSSILLTRDHQPFLSPLDRPGNHNNIGSLQAWYDKISNMEENARFEELAYVLPEQLEPQNEPVSLECSAQYLLGIMARELITGKIQHPLPRLEELKEKRSEAFTAPPPITSEQPQFSKRIEQILLKMTSREPQKRYKTLSEALRAIRQVDLSLVRARDSYHRCTETTDLDTQFFATFYEELQHIDERVREKFQHFGVDKWQRQHLMLKSAIELLFEFAENVELVEPNPLYSLAILHNRHHAKITHDFYEAFVQGLIHTVCGFPPRIPEPFDPQCKTDSRVAEAIKDAWRDALRPGIDYMQSQY
jgi:serine/threonine protein kinase